MSRKIPYVAPYLYYWGVWDKSSYKITSFTDCFEKAGLKEATYAFLVSDDGKTMSRVIFDNFSKDITKFQSYGGKVTVSIGGASGTFLESVMTVDEEVDALSEIVEKLKIKRFDWDVEGSVMNDKNFLSKVRQVAKKMLSKYDDLEITLTLSADYSTGLPSTSLQFVKDFISETKYYPIVNPMLMIYGTGKNGSSYAITALKLINAQLRATYKLPTEENMWPYLSACPMIGKNDDNSLFSPADMFNLAIFVGTNNLAGITFWALNRDQYTSTRFADGTDLNRFSYANTSDFEFSKNALLCKLQKLNF